MNRFIGLRFLILPISIIILVSGCLNNEWEEKENQEKKIIQTYLKNHNITEDQKTEGGIYFIQQVAGTGLKPQTNDYVVINFTGRYLADSTIHETSYDSLKADWDFSALYSDFVYGPLKFKFGYSIAGINEGLSLMREGGKAQFLIPSDMAFYDFNPLIYDIELIKVIRKPIQYEDSILHVYLAEKGFDSTNLRKVGSDTLIFKETNVIDTTGNRTVQANDTVYFRYTGRLIDGFYTEIRDDRVFESRMDVAKPIKYLYNSRILSGSIPNFPDGLKSALSLMREGSHATVILTYKQAFKDQGYTNKTYGYTIVPQYQTVAYDIFVDAIRSRQ